MSHSDAARDSQIHCWQHSNIVQPYVRPDDSTVCDPSPIRTVSDHEFQSSKTVTSLILCHSTNHQPLLQTGYFGIHNFIHWRLTFEPCANATPNECFWITSLCVLTYAIRTQCDRQFNWPLKLVSFWKCLIRTSTNRDFDRAIMNLNFDQVSEFQFTYRLNLTNIDLQPTWFWHRIC